MADQPSTIISCYPEFPRTGSRCHTTLRFNENNLLIVPAYDSIALSPAERGRARAWYKEKINYAAVPVFREHGLYLVTLQEIWDVRSVTDFMLQKTHTFVASPRFVNSFNNFDEQTQTFREAYGIFHQYVSDMFSAWYLLRLGTKVRATHSSLPQCLKGVAVGDQCARSNIRRCGQMIFTLGDGLLSRHVKLQPSINLVKAKEVMSVLAVRLFEIGYCLLTKTMETSHAMEDDLERVLRNAQMIASNTLNTPIPSVAQCTSGIKRQAPALNPVPQLHPFIEPTGDTELPIALKSIRRFVELYSRNICYSYQRIRTLINEGCVMTAYAKMYDDLSTIASLIGYHFCEEMNVRKKMDNERKKEVEDLAGVVYSWNEAESLKRDRMYGKLVTEVTRALNETLTHMKTLNNEFIAVELRSSPNEYYSNQAMNFLIRMTKRLNEVLSNPGSFAGQNPFKPFIDELRSMIKSMVDLETRCALRQPPIPKLPERVIRFRSSGNNVMTVENDDLDKILYLQHQTPITLFSDGQDAKVQKIGVFRDA